MVDIDEFNVKLLAKYGLNANNLRMEFLNSLIEDFSNEISDTSYANLKKIYGSDNATLQSKNNLVTLRKTKNDDEREVNTTTYFGIYEVGQSGDILKKKAILKDCSPKYSEQISLKRIRILEMNPDGSVIYIDVDSYQYSWSRLRILAKYYNPDTVQLLEEEKENIEVYGSLDDYCIHCDSEVRELIDYNKFSDLLAKIDECRKALNDKIVMRIEEE